MADILYLVVPCYNEEAVLPETSRQLQNKMEALISQGKISASSRILFVDDGSRDRTWEIIAGLCERSALFAGISFSRNRGHQNAILAGLMTASTHNADAAISLDADLQHDINAIDEMLDKFEQGYQVVYGIRKARTADESVIKRFASEGFYRFMRLLGADVIPNHADYRLMGAEALRGLAQFKEVNLFLRGLVPLVGFKSTQVVYEQHERFAGESKYSFKKMVAFALDGITSLSVRPIRFISLLGAGIFAVSLLVLAGLLIAKITGNTVQGWTSLIASIWMLSGVQLLCFGLLGEYIGKIYSETKARPRYIIEKTLIH